MDRLSAAVLRLLVFATAPVRCLQRRGANWSELAPGWDLDTSADLRRWRRLQVDAASASPKASVV